MRRQAGLAGNVGPSYEISCIRTNSAAGRDSFWGKMSCTPFSCGCRGNTTGKGRQVVVQIRGGLRRRLVECPKRRRKGRATDQLGSWGRHTTKQA